MAGTGKSFAFGVAKEIWEGQGMEVHGACLSGKAAAGLQEGSNVESRTLHRCFGAFIMEPSTSTLGRWFWWMKPPWWGTRQLLDITSKCLCCRGEARARG